MAHLPVPWDVPAILSLPTNLELEALIKSYHAKKGKKRLLKCTIQNVLRIFNDANSQQQILLQHLVAKITDGKPAALEGLSKNWALFAMALQTLIELTTMALAAQPGGRKRPDGDGPERNSDEDTASDEGSEDQDSQDEDSEDGDGDWDGDGDGDGDGDEDEGDQPGEIISFINYGKSLLLSKGIMSPAALTSFLNVRVHLENNNQPKAFEVLDSFLQSTEHEDEAQMLHLRTWCWLKLISFIREANNKSKTLQSGRTLPMGIPCRAPISDITNTHHNFVKGTTKKIGNITNNNLRSLAISGQLCRMKLEAESTACETFSTMPLMPLAIRTFSTQVQKIKSFRCEYPCTVDSLCKRISDVWTGRKVGLPLQVGILKPLNTLCVPLCGLWGQLKPGMGVGVSFEIESEDAWVEFMNDQYLLVLGDIAVEVD